MRCDPQCERVLPVPRVGRIFRIRDVVGSVRLSPARVKRLVWANGLVNARSGQAAPRPGGEPLRQVAVLSDPGSGPKIHHRPWRSPIFVETDPRVGLEHTRWVIPGSRLLQTDRTATW